MINNKDTSMVNGELWELIKTYWFNIVVFVTLLKKLEPQTAVNMLLVFHFHMFISLVDNLYIWIKFVCTTRIYISENIRMVANERVRPWYSRTGTLMRTGDAAIVGKVQPQRNTLSCAGPTESLSSSTCPGRVTSWRGKVLRRVVIGSGEVGRVGGHHSWSLREASHYVW